MVYVTWKLDWTPYVNNTWTATPEVIDNPRDILVRVALGETKDSFGFRSTNFNGKNNFKFNPNDRINIYRIVNNDLTDSTNILMTGTVKEDSGEFTGTQDTSKIDGYNYSELVAGAITFVDAREKTIPEAIQLALTKVGNQGDFKVTWHPDNKSVRTNGSAFPNPSEPWFNWSLKRILEKYSAAVATEDGAYFWYVTNDNKLRWFSQNDGTAINNYVFNTATDPVKTIKYGKDTKDVKNHIIIRGGRGPDGKGIQESVVDYQSVARHGRKFMFITSPVNYAEDIIAADTRGSDSRYPEDYTGFVTTWEYLGSEVIVVEGITMTPGQKVTGISTPKQYNACVRQQVKKILRRDANETLTYYKFGKLKIDLSFQAATKTWVLGDLITSTIPTANISSKVLRITEIQYSTTVDTYSLVEDKGSI